jgi:hypothetical protein
MGQMKSRKSNSNGTSSKAKPEAGLLDQLSAPLRDFVADFKLHGKSALEQVRQESPSKYLELSAKLVGLVAMLKPESDSISKARTMQEIAVALLKSVGLEDENEMTPDMIDAAVKANDAFIARLEAIRDAAAQDGGESLYEAATNSGNPFRG